MQTSFIQKGFTLVELLIVVIILAILAAIVVPQFTNTTKDANESALDSNLANIRSVIDLYAQQHKGNFPGHVVDTACNASVTSAGARNVDGFRNQLTLYSNSTGAICNKRTEGANSFPLGPYLNKRELPTNPVTGVGTLVIVDAANEGNLLMDGDAAGGGWKYDSKTGKFIANDTSTNESGVRYDRR